MKNIVLIFTVLLCTNVFAQRLTDATEIETKAKAELQAGLAADGDITAFVAENDITGSYTFEYIIGEKGKVITLNKVEATGGTIPMQNALKKFLFYRKFSFKMAKGSQYQFLQSFNF